MRLKRWARAVTGLLLLFAGFSAWAELEVIPLRHRTVYQVLPVLRPLVAGDRVMLDISPRRDTYGPGSGSGGVVNVQRIASTASGRLGEWFELGAASQDESRQAGGLLSGTSALRQEVRRVWIKVEEIK